MTLRWEPYGTGAVADVDGGRIVVRRASKRASNFVGRFNNCTVCLAPTAERAKHMVEAWWDKRALRARYCVLMAKNKQLVDAGQSLPPEEGAEFASLNRRWGELSIVEGGDW